jgi:hypothetical protein
MVRLVLVSSVFCAAAILAGPASGITPAAYAKRADAICADYKTRVARIPRVALSDLAGIYRGALAVLAIAKQDVAKIHALPLPGSNRAVAQAWVATHDRLLVLLGKLRDAAKRKDATAVGKIVAMLNANGAKGHALARRLGMKVCSVGG